MPKWTHLICQSCWDEKNPNRELATMIIDSGLLSPCCFCGDLTTSGIYIRENSDTLLCKGE